MEKKIIDTHKVVLLDELLCLTSIDDAIIIVDDEDEEQDYINSKNSCEDEENERAN